MYGLNYPVSAIRTKVRQEFERHRYVKDLTVVDVLISKSHQEFQVGLSQLYSSPGQASELSAKGLPEEVVVFEQRT